MSADQMDQAGIASLQGTISQIQNHIVKDAAQQAFDAAVAFGSSPLAGTPYLDQLALLIAAPAHLAGSPDSSVYNIICTISPRVPQ